MSADNGIYILKLKDQYRIIHAQAIENLWWSHLDNKKHGEMIPTRIYERYSNSPPINNLETTYQTVFEMAQSCTILEYGIQMFELDKTWEQIIKEAKEYAKLEIEAIKNNGFDWQAYYIPKLEKIIAM